MKKVIVTMMAVLLMVTTMAVALGDTIPEKVINETIINGKLLDVNDDGYGNTLRVYDMGDETRIMYETKDTHIPNYIVTIGGGRLIKVKVDHHPVVVEKIGEGVKWVGEKVSNGWNKIKGVFTKGDE